LLYIVTSVVAMLLGGRLEYALLLLGAESTPMVLGGEVWRIVTSAFLHGGILHLLLNMYAFLMVGGYIEKFYGRRKLLTIYVVTAIFAGVATLIADVVEFWGSGSVGYINSISIGASGAIFGMVGVLIGNRFKRSPYEPQLGIDTQQLITLVVYNLLIGVGLNFFSGSSFINIWAHVGGLLGGLILGMVLSAVNVFYMPKWKKIVENVLFFISLVILIVSFIAQIIFIISHLFKLW
jgi:rhomboid protease GluP